MKHPVVGNYTFLLVAIFSWSMRSSVRYYGTWCRIVCHRNQLPIPIFDVILSALQVSFPRKKRRPLVSSYREKPLDRHKRSWWKYINIRVIERAVATRSVISQNSSPILFNRIECWSPKKEEMKKTTMMFSFYLSPTLQTLCPNHCQLSGQLGGWQRSELWEKKKVQKGPRIVSEVSWRFFLLLSNQPQCDIDDMKLCLTVYHVGRIPFHSLPPPPHSFSSTKTHFLRVATMTPSKIYTIYTVLLCRRCFQGV